MQIFLNTIGTSWIIPGLSKIFLFIDAIVYAILEGAVNIFFTIGSMNTNTLETDLSVVIGNANTLVGIYILFKISLLFIQYLVEPDKFKDKAQGGAALVKNVVIVLILLILLKSNVLFGTIGDIQKVVFNDGGAKLQVLDKLGVTLSEHDMIRMIVFGKQELESPGHSIAVKSMENFLFVNGGSDTNVVKQPWDAAKAGPSLFDPEQIFGTVAGSQIGGISFFHLMNVGNIFTNTLNVTYTSILSTVFGVYMVIKFFKYGLQLIIRFMKLLLMQILSPIAIVSYVTPSGKATFKNFWKTYFTIYLELFIRLLVAYLSIYMMYLVLNNSAGFFGNQPDYITQLILDIMILMGINKFMDEMPNIIASLFGGKLDDKQKSLGAILGGVVGAGISMGARTVGALAAGRGIGSALGAGLMGIPGGFLAGSNASNMGDFIKQQIENFSGSYGKGYNVGTSGGNIAAMQTSINKSLGINKLKADGMQKVIDANTTMSKNTGGMKSATEDAVSKLFGKKGMDGYKERNAQMQQLNETIKESSTDGMMFRNSSGGYISMDSFSKLSNTEAQGYSAVTTQELIEERSDLDKKLTDEYKEMVDERLGRNYDTFENLSEEDRTKLLNGYDVLDSTGNKIDISIEEAVAFQQYHNDYTTQQKELPSEYKDEFKKLFNVSRGSNGKYKTNEKQATAEYNTNARNMKVEKDKLNN